MSDRFNWWSNLRHGGLLLDTQRLTTLVPTDPAPLSAYNEDRLRRRLAQFQDDPATHRGELVSFVLEAICGFANPVGEWKRGSHVGTEWSRKAITGEAVRPRHLWIGQHGATMPVFIDDEHRLGIGRGRRVVSHVLGWLRQGKEQLAIITNGQEWRLIFAGLDYDAFCQWDIDGWFAEGTASPELGGFRALIAPPLWTPPKDGEAAPLLAAINESRKGQADLSQILGERVRQAAELLVQAHTPALKDHINEFAPPDIYRAAVRMIMRLVVVLFAESREGLLARDNPIFHGAYSLQGLREQLERISQYKLVSGVGAYPRILALLQLIHQGSSHPALPVPAYGGELFAPGRPDDPDGMKRALYVFETACFGEHQATVMTDYHVRQILDLLTRTKVKIRQGRTTLLVPAPVDFSTLDSEYIGILYEGLLDFELRCAVEDEPIVFLAVGNQPALPLSTLEGMDDRAIKNLLEKFEDTSSDEEDDESGEEEAEGESDDTEEAAEGDEEAEEEIVEEVTEEGAEAAPPGEGGETEVVDPRYTLKSRAEAWARRACEAGNLVRRPRGRMTPERQMQFEQAIERKARQLIVKVVLPGEWFLVRWGGTRKGSGTFYTRPQLAVPTVHRTLRPLVYDPPTGDDGQPDTNAPAETWIPKKPEEILRLKVCDPACGSGSFPLAALRFLTTALYQSLIIHERVRDHGGRAVLDLIFDERDEETLASEALPCRPEDDDFEPRTRAILRRYIVERCIYGVDLDPLAVELCRLSLWIETLDRNLPLTFLNHKIKCGNSLVGAWFDQFLHYPVMACEREGGDKNHSNGVHFPKEGWTRAIKAFKARVKPDLIAFIDGGTFPSMYPVDLTTVRTVHDVAERALQDIHQLGIAQVGERAARYEALRASPEFQRLKDAFDLWCALWFWPADQLEHAPLPSDFTAESLEQPTSEIAREVATQQRFFHWELEFPDVFNNAAHGFDAILGNPPWENLQPNPEEFFSNVNPLFRTYVRTQKIQWQAEQFNGAPLFERSWLVFQYWYKCMSNWVSFAGEPFGDQVRYDTNGAPKHDFNLGDRGRRSYETSQGRHDRWLQKREQSTGYASVNHPFRYQIGRLFTYKLFVETGHALLNDKGRLGLIIPSGLYSDAWSQPLRELFLDTCRWEWLFGFENREKIFDIHRSFKFNPIIVEKAASTDFIQTAFMRHEVADWENAERVAIKYPLAQVNQFSARTRTFLEIRNNFDLRLLEGIYSRCQALGSEAVDGWGIKLYLEYMMNTDAKLFPVVARWETDGYIADEYNRWIKGNWQLRTSTSPAPPNCNRCDIDPGIILSRDGQHLLSEDSIEQEIVVEKDEEGNEHEVEYPMIAFPVYQGKLIWLNEWAFSTLDASFEKQILLDAKYLLPWKYRRINTRGISRIVFRDISNATNARSFVAAMVPDFPCGNPTPVLTPRFRHSQKRLELISQLTSFVFDWTVRLRMVSTHVNFHIVEALPLSPPANFPTGAIRQAAMLNLVGSCLSPDWLWLENLRLSPARAAYTRHERLRLKCSLEAIIATTFGVDDSQLRYMLAGCDEPLGASGKRDPKGFWRVDRDKPPEHRHTVLSLIAFDDLQQQITASGGDVAAGIEAFCNQNDGQGWMLPETLRLADYGLGHDDRAREPQPVRACFGPRFYDWQLAQTPEESWRECHLHARNLLGAEAYQRLIDEIEGRTPAPSAATATGPATAAISKKNEGNGQGKLFDTEHMPLFPE